jgi:multidrug transporter EmrE-like cation transporter
MFDQETHSTLLDNTAARGAFLLLGWGMVLLFVVLNITGGLLLKNEIQKLGILSFNSFSSCFSFLFKLMGSWKIFIAVGSLFGSTIAWSIALANLELSRAYPVGISLHFLAMMTSAMLIYGESLTFFKVLGAFLILSGVVCFLQKF